MAACSDLPLYESNLVSYIESVLWWRLAPYSRLVRSWHCDFVTVVFAALCIAYSLSQLLHNVLYVWRNNEARSSNHCCSGKAISTTYRECVFVAFGISMQCACAILPSVTSPALTYFSTLFHKRLDFRKKVTEHKMCVLIFSINSVWNISHSKKNWTKYDHKCISVCCM
jgi:hypothetical protein